MFSKTLAFLGLASVASAHIVMTNPVPIGNPNNSPLDASGSDFPCKGPVQGGGDTPNVYEQGSIQQLAFKGTAVHGGGSCQVSVTTDLNPTRDSVWKVIKSIEGGCPARDTEGNMGDNASADVPYTYDFTIPSELASGEYVFAWSWFNKVGNREMYMNCAAVSVTGDGGSDGFLDELPNMFVANIGNGCSTNHGTDVKFPDAGKDVDRFNGATEAFGAPTGSCGESGPAPEPTSPPTNSEPQPDPTSAPEDPAPTTVPGGVFITVTNGTPEPTEAPETPEPEPEVPVPEPEVPEPQPEPQPEPDAPETEPEVPEPQPEPQPEPEVPVPDAGSFPAGEACSNEGSWNCVGGNTFQRCASSSWSSIMALAAGMTCEPGVSTNLRVDTRSFKTTMRRSLRIRA